MKILFTGGGSGGHIFPIIAIARELRKIYPQDLNLSYIGPKDDFASVLLSQEGIKMKTICAGKVRRYITLSSIIQNFFDIFIKIPIGMIQSFIYVFFVAPDLIFSKGGFGSFPPAVAGWILQTPIFMHESDVTPGASNRLISKFAKKIFVSFPHTEYFPLSKIIRVGNPIRKELLEESREEAEDSFNITNEKPVILVLGGSQGAQRINDEILEVLPQMLKDFELIHQTGKKNFKQIEAESKTIVPQELEKYYHPFPFFKEQELKKAYLLADLVVSRAGAGSIFEIAAFGKPSILVPIAKAAQNHQIKNAYNYSETGASQVLEESNFSSNFFLEKLRTLFSNPDDLEKMSQEAKNFSKISAAKDIAKNIVDYLFY